MSQCSFCMAEVGPPIDPDDFDDYHGSDEYRDEYQRTPNGTPITTENFPDADFVCYDCGRTWPVEPDEWFPTVARGDMMLVRDDGEIAKLVAVDGPGLDARHARLDIVNTDVADEWVHRETMNERFRPYDWGWDDG